MKPKPMKSFLKPSLWLALLLVLAIFTFAPAQINNPPAGSGSGTVSANNGQTNVIATYAAAGGSTTVGPASSGNPSACMPGATSGEACMSPPAVAGTSTNGVTYSNVFLSPDGAVGTPAYGFTNETNSGWYRAGAGDLRLSIGATDRAQFTGSQVTVLSGTSFAWGSSGITSPDLGVSRSAAGVLACGTATPGNTTCRIKAAGYMSVGTTFTSNAGCGDTTLVGGATAGKYTSVTAGSCTTVITMGNAATAPNGWNCTATDLTTAADNGNIRQTATTTTTASLNEGTVVANDVIQFSCIGY